MLGSKSHFFTQDRETLADKRAHLVRVLYDFGCSSKDVDRWLFAYDYFTKNPEDFDGATIVKDLNTIGGYDGAAGNHDIEYLNIKFWSWKGLVKKLKADYQYGIDQERTGKGSFTSYTRTVLLWLSTPFYYLVLIYKTLKR